MKKAPYELDIILQTKQVTYPQKWKENHMPPVSSYIIDHYDEMSFEIKEQFLRDIFNIEIESRQTKKVASLIKKAKFRELKWFKNYAWSEQIHLPSTTSQEHICELQFFEGKHLLEIPKLTFKTSSCAPLEFFLHFSGIAACTKQCATVHIKRFLIKSLL